MKHSKQILQLYSEGYTALEIAKKLGINKRTIEGVLSALRMAYGAKTTTHLVVIAIREGIVLLKAGKKKKTTLNDYRG